MIHGRAGEPERVVWAEANRDMRKRLIEILSAPQTLWPVLAHWLQAGDLRFQTATLPDAV